MGLSTRDHPAAAEHATVAGKWRQPGERGDAPALELPEFGQIGHEGAGHDWADAGNGAQQVVGLAPGGRRAHQAREVEIEAAQGLFESRDMGIQLAPGGRGVPAAAARDEGAEGLGLLIGDGG